MITPDCGNKARYPKLAILSVQWLSIQAFPVPRLRIPGFSSDAAGVDSGIGIEGYPVHAFCAVFGAGPDSHPGSRRILPAKHGFDGQPAIVSILAFCHTPKMV